MEVMSGQNVETIGSRLAPKRYIPRAGATQDKERSALTDAISAAMKPP